MLQPKRLKHRKQHRGRMSGVATGGTSDRPAWVGRGSGLIKAGDRHPMLSPSGDRSLCPAVGEAPITPVDRASIHVGVGSLDVDGALRLASEDGLIGQVGSALLEDPQVLLRQDILSCLPITELLGNLVGSQAEDLHRVVPLGRPRGIDNRWGGEEEERAWSVETSLT